MLHAGGDSLALDARHESRAEFAGDSDLTMGLCLMLMPSASSTSSASHFAEYLFRVPEKDTVTEEGKGVECSLSEMAKPPTAP
ncbi:hypothetical protein CHH54_03620 [Bacillus sp. 7520-S]|nr:hypothetical protein CHH54_03620 [Bacillus sp. 7520-S]